MNIVDISRIITGELPYQNIRGTKPIVLIGKADFGPTLIPVEADSLLSVQRIFGTESELTKAYIECIQAGGSNIYLVKINGESASITLKDDTLSDKIKIESIDASDDANKIIVEVYEEENKKYLIIEFPDEEYVKTYQLNGKTLGQIVSEINYHAFYAEPFVCAELIGEDANAMKLSNTLAEEPDALANMLSGGMLEGAIRPIILFSRLRSILNYLLATNVRYIGMLYSIFIPGLISYDTALYNMLSEFSDDMAKQSTPCIVTVGLPSSVATEESIEIVKEFSKKGIPYYDDLNELQPAQYEISEFINIILCKLKFSTIEDYISNGVASYCGILSSLNSGASPTNKRLVSIEENFLELHDETLKLLTEMGYTVICSDSLRIIEMDNEDSKILSIYKYEQDLSKLRVYKAVNLLYGSRGAVFKELKRSTKPLLLGNTANVLLISDISNNISRALENIKMSSGDIKIAADRILNNYSDSVKKFNSKVNTNQDRGIISHELYIELTLYGEVDSIGISINL